MASPTTLVHPSPCQSWCAASPGAAGVHRTGQCLLLPSLQRTVHQTSLWTDPLGHIQSAPGRATEADLPQLYGHGETHGQAVPCPCQAGWPGGARLVALPRVPRCPGCGQPLPLRLGAVLRRVLAVPAWLGRCSAAVPAVPGNVLPQRSAGTSGSRV